MSTRSAARTTCRARATWARFPHELPGYRHVSDDTVRHQFEELWGRTARLRARTAHPEHVRRRRRGNFKGLYVQGEDIAQSDPNTHHVQAALSELELCIVQDLFLNETAKFAHVFLPGTSFLEKDGTFTNAERRINRVRPVMAPRNGKQEWEVVCELATAMGYPMHYAHPSEIMDEIAQHDADLRRRLVRQARRGGQRAVAVQRRSTPRHADHARRQVRPRQGPLRRDPVRPDRGADEPPLPAHPHDRADPVAVQRRRPDSKDRERHLAPGGPARDPPYDAEERGVVDGGWVALASRVGETELRAHITDRVPQGVVYTTFHHPGDGRQRRDDRALGLGDELPRVQGDGRPGAGTGAGEDRPGVGRSFATGRVLTSRHLR